MSQRNRVLPALGLFFLLGGTRSWADTVNVTSDTFTNPGSVNQKNGTNADIIVRNTTGDRYGFVRFDLSALPPGAAIARATLRLYASQVLNSGTLDLKPVLGAWEEATLSHSITPGLGAVTVSAAISSGDQAHFVLIDVTRPRCTIE